MEDVPNHLNTPRLVADATGTTVWKWDQQDPFGNNVPDENPSGLGTFDLPLRLPGQYFERETNLHYNLLRDYDAGIGRYVESDPIGLTGGINTYAYVSADPLATIDPTGENPTAVTRSFQIGWRIGESLNPHIQPAIASALDSIMLSETQEQVEKARREWQYERVRKICNQPPPNGLDACAEAYWRYNKAIKCKNAREEWDHRWERGRHASQIEVEVRGAINNAIRDMARYCRGVLLKCPPEMQ